MELGQKPRIGQWTKLLPLSPVGGQGSFVQWPIPLFCPVLSSFVRYCPTRILYNKNGVMEWTKPYWTKQNWVEWTKPLKNAMEVLSSVVT